MKHTVEDNIPVIKPMYKTKVFITLLFNYAIIKLFSASEHCTACQVVEREFELMSTNNTINSDPKNVEIITQIIIIAPTEWI